MDYPPTPKSPSDMEKDGKYANNGASALFQMPSVPSTSNSLNTAKEEPVDSSAEMPVPAKRGFSFWMIMLSLSVGLFMSATDLTGLATSLPSIAADLESDEWTWIISAYTLASTCLQPVFGGFAQTFGRKPVVFAAVLIFTAASVICASSHTLLQMIIGRTIQGIGGGGILALTEIVVADLVPVAERGPYLALISLVWAVSAATGPIVGGALAQNGQWRWLFWMNLPLGGIALALITFCMHLKSPPLTLVQKVQRLDWPGIGIFLVGSTSLVLGLTWGGAEYEWSDAATLVPIIGGSALLAFFFYYEKQWAHYPIVPFQILADRTCLASYLTSATHGIVAVALIYYLPSWFQAVKGQSPIAGSISIFPLAFLIAPSAVFAGILVKKTQKYRTLNIAAWAISVAGAGLLTLIRTDSSLAFAQGIQAVLAIGVGLLFSAIKFVTVAPLPPSLNAQAMSFFTFSRSFGNVLGVTIGSAVLATELRERLPEEYLSTLPSVSAAFSRITYVKELAQPLRGQVETALSDSIRVIWFCMIGICAAGLACSLLIRALPLGTMTDEQWGLAERRGKQTPAGEKLV